MKLIILRLDATNKPSPIFKGVAEIRIDNQPYKGINLTTRHTLDWRHHEWQQFTTWQKSRARSYLALVSSSMRMSWRTHLGGPNTISLYTHKAKVRYPPTCRHVMLLSLGIPYVQYALIYFKCLFIRTQLTQTLIDTGGGYHLGVLNFQSRPLSTLPSSILHFPLIAPPGLQLCQPFDHFAKPHRTSIDRKGPIMSWLEPLIFYHSSSTDSLHN
jgi:hypothetical protein